MINKCFRKKTEQITVKAPINNEKETLMIVYFARGPNTAKTSQLKTALKMLAANAKDAIKKTANFEASI